ncbi:unnamed protein product [Effrenium voratum]|uniref:Uncharacterized protein n=1 Tax=Effrenium voratum TaxID=2562239 RepID=A0AA36J8T9_9DINO|nr:unnamed protein product [Effrenium voratum]
MLTALRRLVPRVVPTASSTPALESPLRSPLSQLRSPLWSALGAVREKQTKVQAYWKPARAKPCGQRVPNKGHIGLKATPAEYVEQNRVIVKQRTYLAKNPHVTRKRHFKYYPGVNVTVMKNTSLKAAVSGRVKLTHDVTRDVMIMNVLAEPREELQRDDLWRYRTEHVESNEENRELCALRCKAFHIFGKDGGWVNQPVGPRPMKPKISNGNDRWNNPCVRDALEMEPFAYPLSRDQLRRHIRKVRARQAGVPEEQNDPEFQITDIHFKKFHGQTAQR